MRKILQILFSLRLNQIYSTDITIFKLELILNIETTTRHCSVALFQGKELISSKSHISNQYSHSELLTTFVKYILFIQIIFSATLANPLST